MNIFELKEDDWLVPEIFAFFSRFFQIMGLCCILSQSTKEDGILFTEKLFVFSCALVFFLNCLEFIGPIKDNLLVQVGATSVGLLGAFILLADSSVDNPGKELALIFSGVGFGCNLLVGGDFYYHLPATSE